MRNVECTVETPVVVHKFEFAGLGKAPFHYAGFTRGSMSCQYCGTHITNLFYVRSTDGHTFIVGCECIKKTGDSGLIRLVNADIAKAKREEKAAKAVAAAKAAEEAFQAKTNSNGFVDLRQVVQNARQHTLVVAAMHASKVNAWLIDVMQPCASSQFVCDMISRLNNNVLNYTNFSNRQIDVMRDIYGKAHGRYNSKAYNAAVEEFWKRVDPNGESCV